MIILVNKCCFYVDLRIGVYIWAWVSFLISLAGVVVCAVYFDQVKDDEYAKQVFIVIFISLSIHGFISILLATGVRKRKGALMRIYFLLYLMSFIIRVSFILISVVAYLWWISLLGLLIDVIPLYMLVAVVSLYREFFYSAEKKSKVDERKPSDNEKNAETELPREIQSV